MKRKLLLFITALFLAYSLISCTDNNKDNASNSLSSQADESSTTYIESDITSDSSGESPLSAESEQALKDEMSRLIDDLLFDD